MSFKHQVIGLSSITFDKSKNWINLLEGHKFNVLLSLTIGKIITQNYSIIIIMLHTRSGISIEIIEILT